MKEIPTMNLRSSWPPTCRRRVGLAVACAAVLGLPVAVGAQPGAPAAAASAPVVQRIEDFGVELVGVRLSGADFLIDVRYRVKDVAKAQALLERKIHPVLVNEATGDRFYIPQVPKAGSLRQSATAKQPAQLDKVYFMLFANPDRKLRVGEKVTLHAGDSLVKGLVVQ
jgi:hypothetical protein